MDLQDPQYKTADGAALRIWRDAAPNKFLSEQHGRPIFDEVILVEVITAGSRDSTPVFEVERIFDPLMNHREPLRSAKYDELKQFIENFKNDEKIDASLSGTPLTVWPQMTRSMVAQLRANSVYTLEALAALPDTKLNVVGPDGRSWRDKAKAYLAATEGTAATDALVTEIDALKAEIAAGKAREDAMIAEINALKSSTTAALPPTPTPTPEPPKAAEPKAGKAPPPVI